VPKQIRDYPLYLAPGIIGEFDEKSEPRVYDVIKGENLNPYDIDAKIIIYERQVKEWFLNKAAQLKNREDYGFIILMIAISYIEGVEQYRNGSSSHTQSRVAFRTGFKRIFPNISVSDSRIDDFYIDARCGLFHNGMTGSQIIINSKFEEVIDFSEDNSIKINENLFLDSIIDDFDDYISLLKNKDNIDYREKFNIMYKVVNET